MKRTIDIQKVDGYGNGRKNCMVDVELELDNGNFSAVADLWNLNRSDILMGGQCFNDLLNDYPELKNNNVFMEVYDLWKKYHLNNMHAGTPEQEKALEEWKAQGNIYDYEKACDYLKSIGLYEVPISTIDKDVNPQFIDCEKETYKYSSGWLKERIPEEDVQRIECLIKNNLVMEKDVQKEIDELEPEF